MFELIVAAVLVLLSALLPLKWAFSVSLTCSYSQFYYLISDVATAMFVILFLRILFKNGIKDVGKNALFQNHVLIVVFGALSIAWASNKIAGLEILIAEIKVLIIAAVSLQVFQSKDDLKYLVYGTFAGLIYILIMLNGWRFGFFGISANEYSENINQYGRLLVQYFFPDRHSPLNSNTWAALTSISTGIFAVYYYYNSSNRRNKIRKYVLFGLVAIVTFSTIDLASRGALIGLLSCFLLIFYYQRPRIFYRNVSVVLILFLTGSLTVNLVKSILPQDSEIIQTRLQESEGGDPREKIWETGLNMAVHNIAIGVGLGNASHEFHNYMTSDFQHTRLALHNSFLTHLAELGILGLFLFLRGFYLWQKPRIFRRSTNVLLIVVSFNILINAFAHSFELENYFIAIIYATHKFLLLEQREIQLSNRKQEPTTVHSNAVSEGNMIV